MNSSKLIKMLEKIRSKKINADIIYEIEDYMELYGEGYIDVNYSVKGDTLYLTSIGQQVLQSLNKNG